MKYVKHFFCPYCNKELLNQNEFVECDNENEFWCDSCDTTFIIDEDGDVYEEQTFARAQNILKKGLTNQQKCVIMMSRGEINGRIKTTTRRD